MGSNNKPISRRDYRVTYPGIPVIPPGIPLRCFLLFWWWRCADHRLMALIPSGSPSLTLRGCDFFGTALLSGCLTLEHPEGITAISRWSAQRHHRNGVEQQTNIPKGLQGDLPWNTCNPSGYSPPLFSSVLVVALR